MMGRQQMEVRKGANQMADIELALIETAVMDVVLSREGKRRYNNGDPLTLDPSDLRDIVRLTMAKCATPPSSSTTPEVDERAAFEAWAGPREFDLRRPHKTYHNTCTDYAWMGWQARAALASRPAEVDDVPKPPRTPEEMVAFIGSHFDAMRDETSDPEDIRFTLSVHDLLSAMSDWFENDEAGAGSGGRMAVEQAETRMDTSSQPVVEVAQEVDDEGLPPLPFPFKRLIGEGIAGYSDVYTAEQYRQGQRDAVATDRARRGEKP